jgi:serine/threonine protein kinase
MATPVPQAPLAPAPAPGQVLGAKYRVVRQIGEGGMGVVLEAEHTTSGKRVAIKWLHPKVAHEPDAEERFVREARAAARVRHPNVVDVYDVVQEREGVFLVMELLEGEPLTDVLERGQLPVPSLIALLIEAMRGVSAAHKQGVVHRDIKPDNIFLCRIPDRTTPTPKVLDFGISKLSGQENLSITQTGMALGTPLYMSYEQLQGSRDVDARTDVYAFAVILYEALTGQPPFWADTFSQLMVKIATEHVPPPKSLREEVPGELDRIVLRALAKDRAQRTPSLLAFISELEPFASESAFRAQMTAQHVRLPAIRPPSGPDGPRVRAESGFRPASQPPRRGRAKRTPSEDALERMKPSLSGLWIALAVVFLGALAAYFAHRVTSAYMEPARTQAPKTPAATIQPPATKPALHTQTAISAAQAAARPAAEPAAEVKQPAQPSAPPAKKRAHKPKPITQPPSLPPAPAVEPEDALPHLRAGHPQRQEF